METLKQLGFVSILTLALISFAFIPENTSVSNEKDYTSSELASIDWSDYDYYNATADYKNSKCGDEKKKTEAKKKHKCGEGKCAPGKCGEGKCGNSNKVEKAEHKCGEGKCGEEKMMKKAEKTVKKDTTVIK